MHRPTFSSQAKYLLFDSSKKHFLITSFCVAFALRLALIVFVSDPRAIMDDSQHLKLYEHGIIAHNLYAGHGFAMSPDELSHFKGRKRERT